MFWNDTDWDLSNNGWKRDLNIKLEKERLRITFVRRFMPTNKEQTEKKIIIIEIEVSKCVVIRVKYADTGMVQIKRVLIQNKKIIVEIIYETNL